MYDQVQPLRRLLGIPYRLIYPTFMTQAREGQAIVIKYFFRTFLNLSNYIPEKLAFTKLFLDPHLEFFPLW